MTTEDMASVAVVGIITAIIAVMAIVPALGMVLGLLQGVGI